MYQHVCVHLFGYTCVHFLYRSYGYQATGR
ncbi:hypothetical protein DAI22_04g129950 [Oryza sativa Japonica Group]|nr:hypothetical protein DAI22_04g129950 [Oryza sativa Japonica Group]